MPVPAPAVTCRHDSPAPAAAAAAPKLLQVHVSAQSWVEVIDVRGQSLLSRVVQPGENVELDGTVPLKVKIGNAAATALVFRGQALELAPFTRDNLARLRTEMTERTTPSLADLDSIDPFVVPAAPAARRSRQAVVRWGAREVTVGGDAPVRVQAMTNTDTVDVIGTAIQVKELAIAGSEMVRITVNTPEAAQAVPHIREQLDRMQIDVPLIGDFHYNGHRLLTDYPACAETLSKYRINPGNVGKGDKHDRQFAQMVEVAARYAKPVRIGVNWGSLDQELLTQMMDDNARLAEPFEPRQIMYRAIITSALESARRAEEIGLPRDQIILSCKMSGVQDLVSVYRALARRCDYALHLGLTEAGMGTKGTVASTTALSILLQEGIGDTIRVSLTPQPGEARTQEVVIALEILQSLGLRAFNPSVTACPGCGRTTSTTFQELAKQIDDYLRAQMPVWKARYPGVENMKVAVMGCIVNGPGESKHADIGISLPGTGEAPAAPVFIDGEKALTLARRRHRPRVPGHRRELHREALRRDRGGRCVSGWPRERNALSSRVGMRDPRPSAFAPWVSAHLVRTLSYRDDSRRQNLSTWLTLLRAVKGMNDILPPESARWEWFEAKVRALMRRYGYANVRTPIVEPTALFVRGLGEVTDIVEKEMYSFEDAMNGDRLTLRPENTAGVVRADHRALVPARRRQAALLRRPDVPPRAAAEGTLSAVSPGRCRSARLRRPGRRCGADPDGPRAVA